MKEHQRLQPIPGSTVGACPERSSTAGRLLAVAGVTFLAVWGTSPGAFGSGMGGTDESVDTPSSRSGPTGYRLEPQDENSGSITLDPSNRTITIRPPQPNPPSGHGSDSSADGGSSGDGDRSGDNKPSGSDNGDSGADDDESSGTGSHSIPENNKTPAPAKSPSVPSVEVAPPVPQANVPPPPTPPKARTPMAQAPAPAPGVAPEPAPVEVFSPTVSAAPVPVADLVVAPAVTLDAEDAAASRSLPGTAPLAAGLAGAGGGLLGLTAGRRRADDELGEISDGDGMNARGVMIVGGFAAAAVGVALIPAEATAAAFVAAAVGTGLLVSGVLAMSAAILAPFRSGSIARSPKG